MKVFKLRLGNGLTAGMILSCLSGGMLLGQGTQKEQGAAARAEAQRKLDSNIVLALKKARGEPPFDKATTLQPDVVVQAGGLVLVDLTATVSKELLEQIEKGGGKVVNSFESAHAIRALVPLGGMESLAGRADVKFIARAAEATTNAGGGAAQGSSLRP